jgi:hypothetical protein
LSPLVGNWCSAAEPGAVNRVRRTRRQHGECAEPDAAEQRRAAECRRCRPSRNLNCAVANCGARRSRCRGALCLRTPPIRTHTPTPADGSRRASQSSPRAVPRGRIVAPQPTLWAEPVTINSRSSVSARIAGSCGFVATPPLFRHYARFGAASARGVFGALYHIMHS